MGWFSKKNTTNVTEDKRQVYDTKDAYNTETENIDESDNSVNDSYNQSTETDIELDNSGAFSGVQGDVTVTQIPDEAFTFAIEQSREAFDFGREIISTLEATSAQQVDAFGESLATLDSVAATSATQGNDKIVKYGALAMLAMGLMRLV